MKKKFKLVQLEWADACSNDVRWRSFNECIQWAKDTNFYVIEAGFILEENEKYILFVNAINRQDTYKISQFRPLNKIPKTWIRKRKTLGTIEVEIDE